MPGRSTLLFFMIAVLAIVAMAVLWFFGPFVDPGEQPENGGDAMDVSRLVELRNRGLASLENGLLDESEALFSEMIDQIPNELMAKRNLAISRVLAVKDKTLPDPQQQAAAEESALQAIEDLKQIDKSEVPFVLTARLYESIGNYDLAVVALRDASGAAPQLAAVWFELFDMLKLIRDTDAEQLSALQRAHQLEPDNLAVLLELLRQQANLRDESLEQTFRNAVGLFESLAPGIEKRQRYNVLPFVEAAREALTGEITDDDWTTVSRNVAYLFNVLNADDVTRSDRALVKPHPLEFVLIDFNVDIEGEIATLEPGSSDAIAVTFTLVPTVLGSEISECGLADLNLDSNVDVVAVANGEVSVLTAHGLATESESEPLATFPGVGDQTAILLADLENDAHDEWTSDDVGPCHTADLEIISYGPSGLTIRRSELSGLGGTLTATEIPLQEELGEISAVRRVCASDLNNDGDLDLAIVGNSALSLWSNRGNLTFYELENEFEWGSDPPLDCVCVDWDRDIDTDVLVLLESGRWGHLENLRHGTFRWQPQQMPEREGSPLQTIGVCDADNNGSWDVLRAGAGGISLTTTRLPERGNVVIQDEQTVFDSPVRLVRDWDYDNDSLRDLIAVGDETVTMLRGVGNGKFEQTNQLETGSVASLDVGDIDNDGDDDAVIATNDGLRLIRNEGGNQNHWIDIALLAEQLVREETSESQRVNHYGIGSVIELRSGASYQQLPVRRQRTRFGLGSRNIADAVRILWTNGVPDNVIQPQADQLVCERQSLKGSCPYLYTWSDGQFRFMTDLLWAAPIGLQNPRGQLAPCRAWEYLKIPGEMLTETDGAYRLQVTEELWEIAYFDHVELIAVDHADAFEIYSNEKVGPPEISEYRIHTVQNPRHPISAKNHAGRDLLSEVSRRDDRYAKPFETKLMQGYTEDTWIELDFGLTTRPETMTLLLTGWIYPTDTSLNVALQENPDLPGPSPLSLSVPDGNGDFVEVIPFTGFPGGKTKTIAIDVSKVFLTDDYRIRLHSSMELYWDEIFVTVNEDPRPVQTQPLALEDANLHFRGVSRRVAHSDFGPERYEYRVIDTRPVWPTIDGSFTRYGDVTELIAHADDRLVIMGTGDEMTLRFSAPNEPIPDGWTRDFILHNVGWDKDADLHTVIGQTVEPLPFRSMANYPPWGDSPIPKFPDDDAQYHTRRMKERDFRTLLLRPTLSGVTHP